MAPKPKAVKKDKKDKDTKSEADVKRQKQANMITQLKASEEKKKKVDSGLIEVDESEKEKLDARVSFLAKYRGCDKGEQKLKMLEAFENDKTCKSWQASFTRAVTHTQQDKDEVKTGYKTRPFPENMFNFVPRNSLVLFHPCFLSLSDFDPHLFSSSSIFCCPPFFLHPLDFSITTFHPPISII